MRERRLVVNTGPLLALIAGLGDLDLLRNMYREIHVPCEVCEEVAAGGPLGFGIDAFERATWLHRAPRPVETSELLRGSLDRGEAAVIQLALDLGIGTVCIDELVGRRAARLAGLAVTGSVGILIRAKREGRIESTAAVIERMQDGGIRLGSSVVAFALRESEED